MGLVNLLSSREQPCERFLTRRGAKCLPVWTYAPYLHRQSPANEPSPVVSKKSVVNRGMQFLWVRLGWCLPKNRAGQIQPRRMQFYASRLCLSAREAVEAGEVDRQTAPSLMRRSTACEQGPEAMLQEAVSRDLRKLRIFIGETITMQELIN